MKTIMQASADKPMIVHYVSRDKFTTGYINFMKTVMVEYDHYFITAAKGFTLNPIEDARIVYTVHDRDLCFSKEIHNLLEKSRMFIISGCGLAYLTAFLPQNILDKTFFHFWGGDFYGLRTPVIHDGRFHPRWFMHKALTKHSFKKAGALVFLIDGEYEKFVEITGVENRHFVAPMPSNPMKRIVYSDFVVEGHLKEKPEGTVRIAVGHSAVRECHHIEALKMLAKYKDEDIKIICPLSYGDENYAEEVIDQGIKIFKDKFTPVTRYMDIVDFIKLLATCDVGINNSDRQHGMANISILLGTGAKMYMRSDTSMCEQYRKSNFTFYDVRDIDGCTFEQFATFDTDLRKKNIEIQNARQKASTDTAKEQWSVVFEYGLAQTALPNIGGGV